MNWAWICLRVSIFLHPERRDREGCFCRRLQGGLDSGGMWKAEAFEVNGDEGRAMSFWVEKSKRKRDTRERCDNFV